MPDVFLYVGAGNPNDVILRNPLTSGVSSYIITPSGNIVFSGTAALTFTLGAPPNTITYTPSGGIVFSGAVPLVKGRVQVVSGTLVFSSTSALQRGRLYSPSGSIVFSGAAPQIRARVQVVSGQIVFSGSSAMLFTSGGGATITPQRTLVGYGT